MKGSTAANRGSKIKKLDADYIKHALSPYDFYSHELTGAKLKTHAWNNGGLCPFHADNNPGSFIVNLTTGAFKCYSCGTNGGDVIAFVMSLYGLQFVEALHKLADEWGIV